MRFPEMLMLSLFQAHHELSGRSLLAFDPLHAGYTQPDYSALVPFEPQAGEPMTVSIALSARHTWTFRSAGGISNLMRGKPRLSDGEHRCMNLVDGFRRVSTGLSFAGILFGVLSFASWYLISPALVPLRTIASLTYLLFGLSLAFSSESVPPRLRNAGKGFSLLLLLYTICAGATQTGALGGAKFGFALSSLPPVDLFDCIGFGLLSIALLLLDLPAVRGIKPSDLPCIAAFLLSVMTLIGLLFNVPSFCLLISCLHVSVINAVAFAFATFGVLFARPDSGVMAIMTSTASGGRLARRLVPLAVLLPIVLGGLKVVGEACHVVDSESGLTVIVFMMIVMLLGLMLSSAASLNETDAKRQVALDQLARSEQRIKAIVQQASDAFIVLDSAAMIRTWNARCAQLFGVPEETAVGRPIHQIIDTPAARDLAARLTSQPAPSPLGKQSPFETVLASADGHLEFPAEVSPFTVTSGGEHLYCAFIRDITERKAIESRFRDFYFTVSHELRSPLSSINGTMHLIQEDPQTELSVKSLGLIQSGQSSCKRLIALINDLLDVKRIEVGKFSVQQTAVDPLEVIANSLSNIEGVAKLRNINIETVVNDATQITADADRLVQVLTNFLSNAIKFSPENSMVLVEAQVTTDNAFRFSVSDEGPGIPVEMRPRLFTRFEQLPMRPSFKQVGSGLGLAISKAIVDEHSGEIGVSDGANGNGTTFWFEIPLADRPA